MSAPGMLNRSVTVDRELVGRAYQVSVGEYVYSASRMKLMLRVPVRMGSVPVSEATDTVCVSGFGLGREAGLARGHGAQSNPRLLPVTT